MGATKHHGYDLQVPTNESISPLGPLPADRSGVHPGPWCTVHRTDHVDQPTTEGSKQANSRGPQFWPWISEGCHRPWLPPPLLYTMKRTKSGGSTWREMMPHLQLSRAQIRTKIAEIAGQPNSLGGCHSSVESASRRGQGGHLMGNARLCRHGHAFRRMSVFGDRSLSMVQQTFASSSRNCSPARLRKMCV